MKTETITFLMMATEVPLGNPLPGWTPVGLVKQERSRIYEAYRKLRAKGELSAAEASLAARVAWAEAFINQGEEMTKVKDARRAAEYWLDTPFGKPNHHRETRYDFTEDEVRLKLRRTPFDFGTADIKTDFGTYCGKHGDKYIVVFGVIKPEGYDEFDSFEELLVEWELD